MRADTLFRLGAILSALAVPSASIQAASASAMATANIVAPIAIVNTTGLAFGDIYPGTSAGTIVLSHDGTRSANGGSGLASGADVMVARFAVSGAPGGTYGVSLPSSAVLQDGNGNTMLMTDFSSDPEGVGQLDPNGAQDLAVGATLKVQANQPTGAYSGTFVVTIEYN